MSTTPLALRWLAAWPRYSTTVNKAFLVFFLGLFAYAVADWRRWLPFEPGFQPLRMVLLSGALVLQPLASLVQRRSMLLFVTLMAASIALMVATFAVSR